LNNDGNIAHPRATAFMASRSLKFVANSVSGDGSVSVDFDVPFPTDYSELLDQVTFYYYLVCHVISCNLCLLIFGDCLYC
jgi:hypothetical protein